MRRLILSLFLITNSAAWATGTPDNQPQVVIPVTPLTDLADFDYSYTINQMHLRGMFIELTDGTLWEVAEMGPESKIFFANREVPLEFDYVEDLTVNWQPGESLIFHKLQLQRCRSRLQRRPGPVVQRHTFSASFTSIYSHSLSRSDQPDHWPERQLPLAILSNDSQPGMVPGPTRCRSQIVSLEWAEHTRFDQSLYMLLRFNCRTHPS